MTADALEDLVARFAAGTIPIAEWTHFAHLRVGTWHVARFGADEAIARLRSGIRALNERHGTPNSATGGYHETITVAYVRLIAAALAADDGPRPLEQRVEDVIAGPLGERDVLLRFWSRERLMSPQARRVWLPPDLAPLVAIA